MGWVYVGYSLTGWVDDGLRRDPRMVERKKTGLAKARKRVSRLFHSNRFIPAFNLLTPSSMRGSSGRSSYSFICSIRCNIAMW